MDSGQVLEAFSPAQLQQYLSFAKFLQFIEGAYLWEFVTTLRFDVRLIRENGGTSSWAKWVYFASRLTTLTYVLLNTAASNMGKSINCIIISKSIVAALYLSITCASALIGVRIIAIWNKDIRVVATVVVCLLAELALNLRNVTQIEVAWIPGVDICSYTNVKSAATNITAIMVCDAVLQVSMMVGLLRRSMPHKGGILHLLWKQGLIWTTTALVTEVPSVVLVYLNSSDNITDFFGAVPAAFILSICATRLYRSLYTFARDPTRTSRNVSVPLTPIRRYHKNQRNVAVEIDVHRLTELHASSSYSIGSEFIER